MENRTIYYSAQDVSVSKVQGKRGGKKVLCYSESWGIGGIENFSMNLIKSFSNTPFKFDIFSVHDSNSSYDDFIEEHGGHRFTVFKDYKPNLLKRTIFGASKWWRVLGDGTYDIVHINAMNGMSFVYSGLAMLRGIPVRIVHSHNSSFGTGNTALKNVMHSVGKFLFGRTATVRLACSREAGVYLFNKKSFVFLNNVTDTQQFLYSAKKRSLIRERYDIAETDFLFGSVGRLSEAKNPVFQLKILQRLRERGIPAVLMLVGSGPMEADLLQEARELGVLQFLRLPGSTDEADFFYSGLDLFSMPSRFEGFPVAAIEAMTSGLPVILSSAIPQFEFSDRHLNYMGIDNVNEWASLIEAIYKDRPNGDRSSYSRLMKERGYDVDHLYSALKPIYSGKSGR